MTEPYHYTECGLDNIYLANGFTHHGTEYGMGVSIDDVDGLHMAIVLDLCGGKKDLAGKEIRFIRKQLDLSQDALAMFLGTTGQSLARWEKGQTELPGSADRLIRLLYLESVKGSACVKKLLSLLQDLDAIWDEQRIFTEDEKGWRAA